MNEEQYIGFENYLNNDMPSEEKIIFEERLTSDNEFRENFELYKETTQFLSTKFSTETIDFKENLKSVSKDYFAENTKSKPKVIAFRPFYFAIAASVTIAFGAWFMMQQNPSYSDYNQHETAIFMERSDADSNVKNAQDFFNNKEYQKAVASFEKIENLTNTEMQYFYGISLIEVNDFVKGELFLNKIKDGNSIYKDKATWNLALSKLKQKKYEDCKKFLKEIPADAEDYSKAQELLKKLE